MVLNEKKTKGKASPEPEQLPMILFIIKCYSNVFVFCYGYVFVSAFWHGLGVLKWVKNRWKQQKHH